MRCRVGAARLAVATRNKIGAIEPTQCAALVRVLQAGGARALAKLGALTAASENTAAAISIIFETQISLPLRGPTTCAGCRECTDWPALKTQGTPLRRSHHFGRIASPAGPKFDFLNSQKSRATSVQSHLAAARRY
jgi:hypothetical protein